MKVYKVKVTNIDWDLSDCEDSKDDNGLPVTAKDLGLPAWDEVVEIEVRKNYDNDDICEALENEFSFCVNGFVVVKDENEHSDQ